ncbi:hypothetical protein JCM10207_002524 [Rhodosporidiobolus poonsookiae]
MCPTTGSAPITSTTSNTSSTTPIAPTHSHASGAGADSTTPASTTSSADPSAAASASNTEGAEGVGAGEPEGGYPPQMHAGKAGLGPHYNAGGGISDKLKGAEEILKGKLTHNPSLVEQGHDRRSGALAQKERAYENEHDEDSPFARPDDGANQGKDAPGGALPAKETTESEVRESGHAASASAATAGTKEA